MSDINLPDEWDNVSDDDEQIVNNLIKLEISNRERIYQQELDGEEFEEQINTIPPKSILNNNNNNNENKLKILEEQEESEEPLLLINFTKWSYDKIQWRNGIIENNDLFQKLMNKLNQDSEFFVTMTDDLMERELAFHTTNKTWRQDIKLLEQQYGTNQFFSVVSYPPIIGGFLVDQIWSKIKERTEWKCVNILKCIYLAKTNRPLLYKHQMAMSLEFMALEQQLLGPTAKRLKDEEDMEYELLLKQYQERMQKKYESQINENIIKNLQQQIYQSEGITNNIHKIQESLQYQKQQIENDQEDGDDDDEKSYCSTCGEEINYSDEDVEEEEGDEKFIEDDEDQMVDNNNDNKDNINNNKNNNDSNNIDGDDESNTTSSYEQSDDDDADNELDEEDCTRKKKKEKLIEERKIRELEHEKIIKEKEKEKFEEPPPPPLNILDKVIAMIFSKLPIQSTKEFHYQMLQKLSDSIKETWISELGILPPTVLWREQNDE